MKFITHMLKQFFAPLINNPTKQFRWTIAAIVILAILLAFTSKAEASHKEQVPIEELPTIEEEKGQKDLFTRDSHPDLYCIALNVYYESRADNLSGKYAVADVVLNRVIDPRYPNTVCKVVEQAVMYESWKTQQHKDIPDEERIYYPKRNMCQFSWFCDGRPDTPNNENSWREAQIIAYNIVEFGRFRGITDGATHYHATYVTPSWSTAFDLKGQIGAHIFYQWAHGKKSNEPVEIGTDGYNYGVPFEAKIQSN